MHASRSLPAALLLAMALSACATTPPAGPVSVTRFVDQGALGAVGKGSFFVEASPGTQLDPASLAPYKSAVARELAALGYVESDRANAQMIAQVRAQSAVNRPDVQRRGPVSVGVGGSTGSYGSGVGLGVGINLGGGGTKEARHTELGVMLRDVQSGATFWEGRAQFSVNVNSPLASSDANATAIAHAMFREFPGSNGETIEVRVSQ